MNAVERLRYIAGNIEQDQREHSARHLREIADQLEQLPVLAGWMQKLTEGQIRDISVEAAEAVAKNAKVAPQLCFPHIYLTLTKVLK